MGKKIVKSFPSHQAPFYVRGFQVYGYTYMWYKTRQQSANIEPAVTQEPAVLKHLEFHFDSSQMIMSSR